jgi:hypothetical protein
VAVYGEVGLAMLLQAMPLRASEAEMAAGAVLAVMAAGGAMAARHVKMSVMAYEMVNALISAQTGISAEVEVEVTTLAT